MKHKALVTADSEYALYIVGQLIVHSKWFEFTPLPDGEYEIKAKNEPGLPEPDLWKEVR